MNQLEQREQLALVMWPDRKYEDLLNAQVAIVDKVMAILNFAEQRAANIEALKWANAAELAVLDARMDESTHIVYLAAEGYFYKQKLSNGDTEFTPLRMHIADLQAQKQKALDAKTEA